MYPIDYPWKDRLGLAITAGAILLMIGLVTDTPWPDARPSPNSGNLKKNSSQNFLPHQRKTHDRKPLKKNDLQRGPNRTKQTPCDCTALFALA